MSLDHLKNRIQQVRNSRNKDVLATTEPKEILFVKKLHEFLIAQGCVPDNSNYRQNYDLPNTYTRGNQQIAYRIVDSIFFGNSEVWNYTDKDFIITDNFPLVELTCQRISLIPEYWGLYSCNLSFQNRPATHGYSCFMNRISGDRSQVFYELIRRNILDQGLVSFNCWWFGNDPETITKDYAINNYNRQYEQAEMFEYAAEHQQGLELIPFCSFNEDAGVAQAIIDSNINLIHETCVADDHITFSEKLFKSLQLPRPWLLHASPGSIKLLKGHGFDVLDDYVDTAYDNIVEHSHRLLKILDQLETFVDRKYTEQDYQRFEQAAEHNQALLNKFEQAWPDKINTTFDEIKKLC
jgi:hypothetical protein